MSAAKKEETKFSDKEVAEVAAECVGLDDGREIDLRAIAYLKRTRPGTVSVETVMALADAARSRLEKEGW